MTRETLQKANKIEDTLCYLKKKSQSLEVIKSFSGYKRLKLSTANSNEVDLDNGKLIDLVLKLAIFIANMEIYNMEEEFKKL